MTRKSAVPREPAWLLTPTTPGTLSRSPATTPVISASVMRTQTTPVTGPRSAGWNGSIGRCRIGVRPCATASRTISAEYRMWGKIPSPNGCRIA